jgi:hypothetical protein
VRAHGAKGGEDVSVRVLEGVEDEEGVGLGAVGGRALSR